MTFSLISELKIVFFQISDSSQSSDVTGAEGWRQDRESDSRFHGSSAFRRHIESACQDRPSLPLSR